MNNWTHSILYIGEEKGQPVYIDSWDKDYPYWSKITIVQNPKSDCLHDNCSSCNGTGIRKDGLGTCIHMISCPCPKCSPRT